MKITAVLSLSLILALLLPATGFRDLQPPKNNEPWLESQLLSPADLAKTINNPAAHQPFIFSIGPGAMIKGSINIGPAHEKENLDKLKQELSSLPKDADIVIYCGCCPFEHCPNIRPAFALLNEMKFVNQKLLSLQNNLKADWIDKGYPVNNQ